MVWDYIKSIILGIVEGITEWLPISSTGHMILVNDIMGIGEGFFNSQIYLYVIQLGAVLAIATLYFKKLNPFSPSKTSKEKKDTWQMWFKVIVACLPAAIAGLIFDKYMGELDKKIEVFVVSIMLIIYGIAFLFIENKNRQTRIDSIDDMTYKTAILIGIFQVLSIIPGTSRSGATILGAMLIGCSRGVAAEFSFFLAIPVMVGVSLLKIVTNDYPMTPEAWALLIVGMVTAYLVSLAAVKFLVSYVRKHDFKVFGIYRIVLGIIVIGYSLIKVIL